MMTTIGSSYHRCFRSSRRVCGPSEPTQPMNGSNRRPAARTTPSCAATTRSPQNVARSIPSWNRSPPTSSAPNGLGPKGLVMHRSPAASGSRSAARVGRVGLAPGRHRDPGRRPAAGPGAAPSGQRRRRRRDRLPPRAPPRPVAGGVVGRHRRRGRRRRLEDRPGRDAARAERTDRPVRQEADGRQQRGGEQVQQVAAHRAFLQQSGAGCKRVAVGAGPDVGRGLSG